MSIELLFLSLLLAVSWVARGLIVGNLHFCMFMIWNMILAAIPAILMLQIDTMHQYNSPLGTVLYLFTWLLFLPNAFYLLTDFMHLNQTVLVNKVGDTFTPSLRYKRGDALYILDSFILYVTATFGLIMGGISLNAFYDFMGLYYQSLQVVVVMLVILLSAIGVYIGRYGRWNSWDAISRPKKILSDFLKTLGNKQTLYRFLIVSFTIVLFELFGWFIVAQY